MFNFGIVDCDRIDSRTWRVLLHRIQGKGFDTIIGTYEEYTQQELDAEYYGIWL